MSLAIATLRGVLWNHGGKIVEYTLMYAASLVVARGLGVADNGVYALVLSLSQLLLVVTSFGLETVINKSFPQITGNEAEGQRTFLLRRILAFRSTAFLGGALCLGLVSMYVPALAGPARDLILVVIAFTLSRALIPLLAMTLTTEFRTDITSWINMGARFAELCVFAWKISTGLTLRFVLVTLLVSGLAQLGAYLTVCRRLLFRPAVPIPLRPFLAFGGIFWTMALVDYVLGRHGDIFMLTHLLPDPSFASLYDVAYSGMQLAQLGATAGLAGVTFAAFARLAIHSPGSMPSFYHLLVRIVTLLTVPLFAFFLFNAEVFVVALYGGPFAGSVRLVQGMALFRLSSRLFGGGENAEYILSLGGVKKFVAVGALSAGCNVALNLALVPSLAAVGSVIASGSANLLATALGFMLIRERVRIQGAFWLKVVFVALACSWAVAWIDTPRPFLTLSARLVAFILVMFAAVVGLKIISPDDRMRIIAALRGLTQVDAPREGASG